MTNDELIQLIQDKDDIHHIDVSGDGYHYEMTVVTNVFNNMRRVARQQWVYALINDKIADGSLHAITIKAYTIEEWEKNRG